MQPQREHCASASEEQKERGFSRSSQLLFLTAAVLGGSLHGQLPVLDQRAIHVHGEHVNPGAGLDDGEDAHPRTPDHGGVSEDTISNIWDEGAHAKWGLKPFQLQVLVCFVIDCEMTVTLRRCRRSETIISSLTFYC
jgi:hypothetical protein